mmetsp:Transcript_4057/g.6947  ORF Transcript_4057/g.6947 Transcript_4057/m.6947 type:complete len:108 (-) Transcript_4057:978-1301(-)
MEVDPTAMKCPPRRHIITMSMTTTTTNQRWQLDRSLGHLREIAATDQEERNGVKLPDAADEAVLLVEVACLVEAVTVRKVEVVGVVVGVVSTMRLLPCLERRVAAWR